MCRLFILLFLLIPFGLAAQEETLEEEPIPIEAEQVAPPEGPIDAREFDRARIEELRSQYNYDQDLRREPTPWERFKAWLSRQLDRFFGSNVGDWITRNIIYLIILASLVFAAIMLSRGGLRHVFHGAPRSLGEVAVSEEDITQMDLAGMIAEAERDGDLRRAIRLHYLWGLRQLVDQGLLNWHPHFTDEDYLSQLKDPVLRSRFSHVVLVFQWVWYGNADVAPARYDDLKRPFIEFGTITAK